jgi:hypothetical protein
MKEETAFYAAVINIAVCATVLTIALLLEEPWALAGLIFMVSYRHKECDKCEDKKK